MKKSIWNLVNQNTNFDIFTKSLAKDGFEFHRQNVGVVINKCY